MRIAGFEQLRVGDCRLPKAEPGSDLGPVAFPGPACRVVPVVIVGLHAKLASYSHDGRLANFYWLPGKPSVGSVKQQQHGEPKAVRTILRHDQRMICRGQHPRFDCVAVIGHFGIP
jgi:hypothetical protein